MWMAGSGLKSEEKGAERLCVYWFIVGWEYGKNKKKRQK